jgi:hypothetical protein
MQKKSKLRFLKNRTWKSRIQHRLRGRPEEVCTDYINGILDSLTLAHAKRLGRKT